MNENEEKKDSGIPEEEMNRAIDMFFIEGREF
jgi:hypothetical protein